MIFVNTDLENTYVIESETLTDNRGFFARTFCLHEFEKMGIDFAIAQCNISFNKKRGTLRGLHYQGVPHEEAKIVRCTKGSIYDVVVDLRAGSSTFKRWISVELNEENNRALYVPKGCAHGFQTLRPNTTVFYQMNEFYHPECARGINYNDPAFAIEWPIKEMTISKKDTELKKYTQ